MPKVKYTGQANYREISAADFKSLGVEDQRGVKWDRDGVNDRKGWSQVVELSDAALAALNEKDTANGYHSYEVVEEAEEASAPDASGADQVQDDTTSSTGTARASRRTPTA